MPTQFMKYEKNPVMGDPSLGTCFDVYVSREGGRYRMDFSWRPKKALAVTFSADGIHWEEPQITLSYNESSGWEDRVNRNCVLKIGEIYRMWYTGQIKGKSCIGYAESEDGIHFHRTQSTPIMVSDRPWEMPSVMNPCVLFENGIYKMWYAAGDNYEPNVLAYAESDDGIHWKKYGTEPIFTADPNNRYEANRVGGCQVIHTDDMGYLMFYIGYETVHKAQICVARSRDGITGWERAAYNPIVVPDAESWDSDACYKPSVLWEPEQAKWMLWYNGRRNDNEYVGFVSREGRRLFSPQSE